MTDLFWPGDHRAGAIMSQTAYLDALVLAETCWLTTLVEYGVAPANAAADLGTLLRPEDRDEIATTAERDGNPVTALVALLRSRAEPATARWLHRGLTSQDVVDTALMLCLREALDAVRHHLGAQIPTLVGLTGTYRHAPMLTRTLTQPALPGTAGRKFAGWLTAVLDAADGLKALPDLPVAVGGAAGTLAAGTELTGSPEAALSLTRYWAASLGLAATYPWHTTRSVITRAGDALVGCCDAWGHLANDIAVGGRAEVGEFTEGSGGGSSTMPYKNNPVLTVLLRRAALTAPALGTTLHAASAASVDERSDGGWHAEWATLRTLARCAVVAASQAADLLAGLRINVEHASANQAGAHGIYAEQHTMSALAGHQPSPHYFGATDLLIDIALQRARDYLKETP
ncbi:lyase family protein [Mycolicibacterium septicum]|uniref:lyase family protein n=1 Tax=Mycolicibacterium septicum TaxID=98668 RepID=UPI0023E27C44|nr:lyase family protein [Mycolicibacterium septicum]MDF3337107.1 lyase family protein [Mycolicibacterium septicum]